jgi:hypothetical protein
MRLLDNADAPLQGRVREARERWRASARSLAVTEQLGCGPLKHLMLR